MERDKETLYDSENEDTVDCGADSCSYTGHTNCHIVPQFVLLRAKQLKHLNLSHNGLTDLKNMAVFVNLESLNLDNNEITDSASFPVLPKLHSLTLNNNRIKYLNLFITRLAKLCTSLTYLSLLGNEACPHEILDSDKTEKDYEEYRIFVASRMPKLKFLDWKPVSSLERDQGAKMISAEPKERYSVIKTQESCRSLPKITEEPTSSKKVRVASYDTGKQSEGNRFIRNNDL